MGVRGRWVYETQACLVHSQGYTHTKILLSPQKSFKLNDSFFSEYWNSYLLLEFLKSTSCSDSISEYWVQTFMYNILSLYVTLAVVVLFCRPGWLSYLCLLSSGIKDVHHHCLACYIFLNGKSSLCLFRMFCFFSLFLWNSYS